MNALWKLPTLLVLGVLACIPALAFAAPPTKEEIAETATWFDGLEWPDLAGKPYVEIMFGRTHREVEVEGKPSVDEVVDGQKVRGFLLAEDARAYTLFSDGTVTQDGTGRYRDRPLIVQRIEKTGPGARPEDRAMSRMIELPKAVEDAIEAVHRPAKKDNFRSDPPPQISKGVALFGLARWCARTGHAELAARLDAELTRLGDVAAWDQEVKGTPFRQAVENGVARVLISKAMADLGEAGALPPTTPSLPRSQVLEEFARIARDFPRSVDHEGAARIAETLHQMVTEDAAHVALDEKALEKLSREEHARERIFRLRDQNYFPGYWSDPPPITPVDELVCLGYAAMPALLEILNDQRLTRSVIRDRREALPGLILTFGDCAEDAISRIAGRDFGFQVHETPKVRDARRAEARHRAMRAWWKQVEPLGEKKMLSQYVSTGRGEVRDEAIRLAEIDPDAAVAALKTGLRTTKSDDVRYQLVQGLEAIKNEVSTATLRNEMRKGKSLEARLAAAWELRARDAPDVTPAMVEEFRKWEPVDHRADAIDPNDPRSLIELLARSGDLEALKALATRNPWLPDEIQTEIIEAVTADRDVEPVAAEAEAFREQIAVSALEFRAGRICDTAARALARRWPQRYAFQPLVTRFERDVRIVRMQNTWRAAHGLEELPEPKRLVPEMANHNPNVVAACRWSGGKSAADFRVAVGELLTADSFLAGLDQLQRALPKNCTGVEVSAERLGDGRGFVVEIDWVRGWRPPARRLKRGQASIALEPPTDFSLKILETGKSLYEAEDRIASMETAYHQDGRFVRAIDEALKSDAGKSLGIYFVSHVEFE